MVINQFGITYLSYKAVYSYQSLKTFFLYRILDPVVEFLYYATLISFLVGTDYLEFVILGNIVFNTGKTMFINLMSIFRSERRFGTLELNIAAPTHLFIIIAKKSIIPLLDSLLTFVICILIGYLFFDLNLPFDKWINLLLLYCSMIVSLLSFSIIFACISLTFVNPNLFLNLTISIFQILCGAMFSVEIFPDWLENISKILPFTHSIEAIRTIYGLTNLSIADLLIKELIIGGVYLIIAIFMTVTMEKIARKNGAYFK